MKVQIHRLIFYIPLAIAFIRPCFAQAPRPGQKMNPKEINLLIDSVSAALNRWYVFPDEAAVISNELKNNLKKGVYNKNKGRSELGAQLNAKLRSHKDLHFKVAYLPELANDFNSQVNGEEENSRREQRLSVARSNHFSFIKKEILQGNIGYLRWDAFDEFVEDALPTYDSAFRFVSQCKALIIDMRYNGGGKADMVKALQNYFFEKKTALNHSIDRSKDTIKRYTDPLKTDFKLQMPIYILSSHSTFSAGEDFTYALQQAKRATIVGDTTGGGAHPVAFYSLGQGFMICIPTRRSFNEYSKTDWEGTGIYPQVYSPSEDAFTKTLNLIYLQFLSSARNENEKKMFLGYLDDVKKNKHLNVPFVSIKNSDAKYAIEIKDSIYGPTNVGRGHGAVLEFHQKSPGEGQGAAFFLQEDHSAWFKLNFNHDTTLTFDIVPIDPANDYDFIFFKCAGNDCVDNIKTGKTAPDRSCHSGFFAYNGATGLSDSGVDRPVSSGMGPTYVRSVHVKAGEVYYLMVNFADTYIKEGKTPYGFTIYFHNYWPKKKPIVLNNVSFNSNEAVLLKSSFQELDKLVLQLNMDKKMNIEIRGHTDGQGSEEKNVELSVNRANAVKDYLVSKHIDAKRISCKGFGSSKPLASNRTEGGRQKNRRVEFAVIMR